MLGLLASIEPMGYLHLFEIDMEVLHNFVMLRVCVRVLGVLRVHVTCATCVHECVPVWTRIG